MAIRQDSLDELRYIKRQNLEQEARIVGNYYRDLIRSYGIDCRYWKLKTSEFTNFKGIIDENTRLLRAYGCNVNPCYNCSADMITYMEVQTDILQLQKWGLNPSMDVTFYFDSMDFACWLATKCGQLKEYPIDETDIYCEVPECTSAFVEHDGEKVYLSSYEFPYELGLGWNQFYKCDMLSGKFQAILTGYDPDNLDQEYTMVCDPYEHVDFNVKFPVNKDLYRSMKHVIENDDYLETLLYLTYKIKKVKVGADEDGSEQFKFYLVGKLHGSVLFYDTDMLGKYAEMIHPMVGDVVEIDFPDEKSREKYEITECFDRQISQDGINPLLHKYIWKCKARRYVNAGEEGAPPDSEADERIEEMHRLDQTISEEVAEDVSMYPDEEDAAYGGYDGVIDRYDKDAPKPTHEKYDFIDDGTAVDIHRFACGSKLVTNGYELLFIDGKGDAYQITTNSLELPYKHALVEQDLRWLKASDSCVAFINIEGESTRIAVDYEATNGELELCLNDLHAKTLDTTGKQTNKDFDNFFKFKGTRTYMWATRDALFVKLESNKQLYRIV